jgi:hypothetical protein
MTPQTAQARRGMFTASQAYRLMGNVGKAYDTCEWSTEYQCYEKVKIDDSYEYVPLSEPPKKKAVWRKIEKYLPDGADTYIIEKVAELLDSDIPESYTSHAMQYGIDNEPFAIMAIQDALGIELSNTNDDQYFFNNGEWGATPDGVHYADDMYTVISTHEVKCPTAHVHTFNCLKVLDWQDLEKHYPCYFWQVIAQLEATGATFGHWTSYRATHEKPRHTVSIIRHEVEDKINALRHRLKLAVERKNQYLESLRA